MRRHSIDDRQPGIAQPGSSIPDSIEHKHGRFVSVMIEHMQRVGLGLGEIAFPLQRIEFDFLNVGGASVAAQASVAESLGRAGVATATVGLSATFGRIEVGQGQIRRNFGAVRDQQFDDGPVLAADGHANGSARPLSVGGVNVGPAMDQRADDVDVSMKTGDAQGVAGVAVHVRFFDVGTVCQGCLNGGEIAFFDGSPKRAVHGGVLGSI